MNSLVKDLFLLNFIYLLKLLPLQGALLIVIIPQGVTLGWELLPFQGVWGISLEVKDAFYILIRLFCEFLLTHSVCFRQGFKYF